MLELVKLLCIFTTIIQCQGGVTGVWGKVVLLERDVQKRVRTNVLDELSFLNVIFGNVRYSTLFAIKCYALIFRRVTRPRVEQSESESSDDELETAEIAAPSPPSLSSTRNENASCSYSAMGNSAPASGPSVLEVVDDTIPELDSENLSSLDSTLSKQLS